MKGRFYEKTEAEKEAFRDRIKMMLSWPECEGCKKRKEWIMSKLGFKPGEKSE